MSGYSVIYADPPWQYGDKSCIGAAELQYKTMKLADIKAMPIAQLAAPDCVLFMWATYPLIREALGVIDAWGFEYKSIAFQWIKSYKKSGEPFFGLGRWTRGNTEPCLLAVRGKPHRVSASVGQLIFAEGETLVSPVGRHSAKPPEVRGRIVQLMGDVPRVELFARELAPGWDAWGNQVATRSDYLAVSP